MGTLSMVNTQNVVESSSEYVGKYTVIGALSSCRNRRYSLTDDLIIDGLVAENAELQEEAEHLRSALDEAYTVIGELDDEVHQLRTVAARLREHLAIAVSPYPAPFQFPTVEFREGTVTS